MTTDNQRLVTEEMEAAIQWWADQLRGTAWQDNGDALQSAVTLLMSSRTASPTEDQIATFVQELRRTLPDHLGDSWDLAIQNGAIWGSSLRTLGVDYHPDRVLGDAATAAGISSLRFPIKTIMWINPGHVYVRNGYGADEVTIYGTPKHTEV